MRARHRGPALHPSINWRSNTVIVVLAFSSEMDGAMVARINRSPSFRRGS